MSRMFSFIDKTWNLFTGCQYNCSYCSARSLALNRLSHLNKYANGFNPTFHPTLLLQNFKKGQTIFIAYMGDLSCAKAYDISLIMDRVREFPDTRFLVCTKNPELFSQKCPSIPDNVYYGTTLETNRAHSFSLAPSPWARGTALATHQHPLKFVSIEPLMDFDLPLFQSLLLSINPKIVEIGLDNYGNGLPQPSKTRIKHLYHFCVNAFPQVNLKNNLLWLKGG